MSESEVLLLFTKLPRPGAVKTRLCPPLTPGQAAELHGAFVADVATQARSLVEERPGLTAYLCVAPFDGASVLESLGLPLLPQEGSGLGPRMAAAIAGRLADGASRVVLRGTDSPLLPAARIREALRGLAAPGVDVVLGPDLGGGYYLVGARRPCAELFEGVPLGSVAQGDTVFARTLSRTGELGLACCVLRPELDIDVPEDLRALVTALRENAERAPTTAACLESFGLLHI